MTSSAVGYRMIYANRQKQVFGYIATCKWIIILAISSLASASAQCQICGGQEYTRRSDWLSSPNFPNSPYPSHVDWQYNITVEGAAYIKLMFYTLSLQPGTAPGTCDHDYLWIGDDNGNEMIICGNHTNGHTPLEHEYMGGNVFMAFHSDGSVVDEGFELRYAAEFPPTASIRSSAPPVQSTIHPGSTTDNPLDDITTKSGISTAPFVTTTKASASVPMVVANTSATTLGYSTTKNDFSVPVEVGNISSTTIEYSENGSTQDNSEGINREGDAKGWVVGLSVLSLVMLCVALVMTGMYVKERKLRLHDDAKEPRGSGLDDVESKL